MKEDHSLRKNVVSLGKGSIVVFDGTQDGVVFKDGIGIVTRSADICGMIDTEVICTGTDKRPRFHRLNGGLSRNNGWHISGDIAKCVVSLTMIGNIVDLNNGDRIVITPKGYVNVKTFDRVSKIDINDVEKIYCRDIDHLDTNCLFSMSGIGFIATRKTIDMIRSFDSEIGANFFPSIQYIKYESADQIFDLQ